MEKPTCELIGANGNIFNLLGLAVRSLTRNKMYKEADEMKKRVLQSHSYDNALVIISEYVEIE